MDMTEYADKMNPKSIPVSLLKLNFSDHLCFCIKLKYV